MVLFSALFSLVSSGLIGACSSEDSNQCIDNDKDTFGIDCAPGPDCNDSDATVNPAASEICNNSVDDDCDGSTDEDCPECKDDDKDTFGDNCAAGLDCDDSDPDIHPGATEICNQVDDDCDGYTDEDDVCVTCIDTDNDGYGENCEPGPDCDDNNAAVNPGATEICNQVDDDCDDETDEGDVCPSCVDHDSDSYGQGCQSGPDCNDSDPDIHPNAVEACDNIDNDCDDATDEDGVCGDCVDADQDGHNAISDTCVNGDDCDDENANINPDATENPRNNIDDDCDEQIDEAIPSPFKTNFVFNEILIDGTTDQDANGDGDIDATDDEFVEIVNTSQAAIDMSGWSLWDSDQATPRHIFPVGFELPAGEAVVVFGGGTAPDDTAGAHYMVATNYDPGINFGLSMNNSGDIITLYDDQMREVIVFAYGDEGIIAAVQDQSITRAPDITGDFTAHTDATGDETAIFSPGKKIDGSAFP